MSNDLDTDTHIEIARCLKVGMSVRQICAKLVVARNTVTLRRAMLIKNGVEMTCPCGQPAGHRGWCHVRYAQSPKRQAFVKSWRSKQLDKPWYAD